MSDMRMIPEKLADLSESDRRAIMGRSMEDISSLYEYVRGLVMDVRERGDQALVESNREYREDTTAADLVVSPDEIGAAYEKVEDGVVEALKAAAGHIKSFHEAQLGRQMWSVEVSKGVLAGRITRPLDRVGCYVPGGRAAYPSTILMTVIPARVAGVAEVVATTPPGPGMEVNPYTLVASDIAGCDRIFKAGGPWGIAGLAYGTQTMPRVDKIVGPGNKYVTAAKMVVFGQVDIDSPAGPSEALILADHTANAEWIAADFLAQLEHDPDSAALLVSTSASLAEEVCRAVEAQYDALPRKEIFEESLKRHSRILIAADQEEAVEFANAYAPEHLQIIMEDPFIVLNSIRHAGSIFLGPYAPIPVGDYASGTNHVLPTGQCARMFSGLSTDDFLKRPTFQYLSKEGLEGLRDTVVTLAEAEGLPMHARAVEVRFKKEQQ